MMVASSTVLNSVRRQSHSFSGGAPAAGLRAADGQRQAERSGSASAKMAQVREQIDTLVNELAELRKKNPAAGVVSVL